MQTPAKVQELDTEQKNKSSKQIPDEEQQEEVSNNSQAKTQKDEHLQHIIEHSKPFWFSQQLVKKPCTVFGACLSFLLIISIIPFALGLFKFNEDSDRDFLVWSDEKVKRMDSVILAREDYEEETIGDSIQPERTVEQEFFQTIIVYKAKKGKTLLTPENVKKMQEIEQYMTTYKENGKTYEDFCLAKGQNDASCADALSIPKFITQSYTGGANQQQIDGFVQQVTSSEPAFLQFASLFDKDFSMTQTDVQVARSMYKFGYPLKGFKNSITKTDDQEEEFKLWLRGFFDYIEKDQDTDSMEITYLNEVSIFDYSNVQIGKDIIFSMLSATFVTIYSCFHTKSAFVGLVGSTLVVLSFPSSFFFYRIVFQIRYIASLHTSVLFLLLGIGADDIFVFFDSFQQAGQIPMLKNDLLGRTSYAYRRASKAMLITSCTTIISFLATAISKLLPIMTYGIFAAFNILASYLIIISAFPAFLVWREQRRIKNEKNINSSRVSVEENQQNNNTEQQQQNTENQAIAVPQAAPAANKNLQNNNHEQEDLSKVQRFFNEKWTVWTFKARYFIIFFFLCLFVFKIVGTLQLDTPTEPPLMIKDHHFLIKALNSVRNDFQTGGDDGNSITINFVWGIKDVNQDDTDQYDPSDRGQIIYDDDFDLASNQSRLLQICQSLRSSQNSKLVSQNQGSIECFMEDFQQYALSQTGQFPVPTNQFLTVFSQFLNSQSGLNVQQSGKVGIIDGKVKYAYISFIGNSLAINGRTVLEPLFDEYEELIEGFNKGSGQGFNKAFQSSGSWLWMVSEKELLNGAIQGIIISLSLAFLILIVSTMNIVISIYSITCIAGVVLGVFMIIWAKGWDFGTFQSMNSIIIIGLSVDYIVHLANTYCESEKKDKYSRVQDMLTTMGVSVLGGGFTTLGAGLFLFGGKLVFFEVMGTLVSSTIGFSLIWSLVLFPALCHAAGPSETCGDLNQLIKKFKKQEPQKQTEV